MLRELTEKSNELFVEFECANFNMYLASNGDKIVGQGLYEDE